MRDPTVARPAPAAPRIALILPAVLLLHVAEEWFGGFPAWTSVVLGEGVSPERFLLLNGLGLAVFTTAMVAAVRIPGAAWLAASFAALLVLNGALHTLATLAWGRYSPGTITGLLLSIPLGIVVLRASAGRLTAGVLGGAVLLGFLIHGIVTFVALG